MRFIHTTSITVASNFQIYENEACEMPLWVKVLAALVPSTYIGWLRNHLELQFQGI